MDILKLVIQTTNLIFNSLSRYPFILFIVGIIFGYHLVLNLMRDTKYVKKIQKLQDSNKYLIDDLISKPLINFIVPAWKEDQVLNKTLTKLLNLSYTNYRVIINAGGNQETIQIADSFKKYDNFLILKQQAGKGKIRAINDALIQIEEGIVFLIDADVQLNDQFLIDMIFPIVNKNEFVVTSHLKPHHSIKDKDLVKFLYIDRNSKFRKKMERYIDVVGINTAMKYEVIEKVTQFTEAKFSDDNRVIGKDLRSNGYKIYYIANLIGETYNYPQTISNFIPQQLRWMENAYYRRREEGKKFFIIKKILATLISIYLIIFPFLIFNINLIMICLYILFFIYLEKIRKIIFFKKTDAVSLEIKFGLKFYLKLFFYIYLKAILNILVIIEIIFFKKRYKKRKNIE